MMAYCNERESHCEQSAAGLGQILSDKTSSSMKRETFVVYLEHSLLLNFRVEL